MAFIHPPKIHRKYSEETMKKQLNNNRQKDKNICTIQSRLNILESNKLNAMIESNSTGINNVSQMVKSLILNYQL